MRLPFRRRTDPNLAPPTWVDRCVRVRMNPGVCVGMHCWCGRRMQPEIDHTKTNETLWYCRRHGLQLLEEVIGPWSSHVAS